MSKLSKFMKNALVALVACVLALGVSACGSHEEEAIRQGVDEMMAVFQNPVENDASSFVDDETLSVLEDYGITGFPTKILIGPDGKIVKTFIGEDPAFYEFLDEQFK